jgi:hypothetical protein
MRLNTVHLPVIALGVLLAAGVLAVQFSEREPAEAIHLMPCADVDGDTAVSQVDLDIESSYFFSTVPPAPAAADMDGDTSILVSDFTFFSFVYTTCQDTPFTWNGGVPPAKGGGTVSSTDLDGDGCDDVDENGLVPSAGGVRNYLSPWDYFNPTKDGQNRIDDILAVISQFSVGYPGAGYTTQTDRSALVGPNPWDLGPPDGVQDIADVLAIIYQYAHDC